MAYKSETLEDKIQHPLDSIQGFVRDTVGKFKDWKQARSKWEDIWNDAERRWKLYTKGKTEKWMADTPTTDTNVAVESALAELDYALFGGGTKEYFGVKKFNTDNDAFFVKKLMSFRLDKQIKLRRLANNQNGLRSFIIRGTLIGMVGWKKEPGYTIQYQPVLDPMTGMPVDYETQEIYVDNLVDRPDITFLALEDVIIEPNVRDFKFATKMVLDSMSRSNVERQYKLDKKKLDSYPYPGTTEEQRKKRREELGLPDADVRRGQEQVEILHVWKWCDSALISKLQTQLDSGQDVSYDTELTEAEKFFEEKPRPIGEMFADMQPTDSSSEVTPSEPQQPKGDFLYHIVILNQGCVAKIEKAPGIYDPDPFFKSTYLGVDGEEYGLGVPYIIQGPQDQLKDILDLSIDNIKLRMYNMIKYKPASSVDKLFIKIEPNAMIPDRSGEDITFVDVPDATASALARENSLAFKIQDASAVSRQIMGTGGSNASQSATGASILQQQSTKRFNYIVRNLGNNLLVPCLEKMYGLERQFTTKKDLDQIFSEEDAQKWLAGKQPGDIFVDVEFEFIPAPDLVSKDLEVQTLTNLLNIGGKFSWFNAPQNVRDLAEAMGKDPKLYILPMQEAVNPAGIGVDGAGVSQESSPLGSSLTRGAPGQFIEPSANGTGGLQ